MASFRRPLVLLAFGVALVGALSWFHPEGVLATPPQSADVSAPQATPTAVSTPAPAPSNTATIVFSTNPPVKAVVTWGKKLLGIIKPGKPLVVVRPRDSGPLDVMVRATGYLPVQTRAHTFSDNRVAVKLTKPEETTDLLGYRAPIEDAGVAPEHAAELDSAEAPGAVAPVPGSFQVVPTAPQTPMLAP